MILKWTAAWYELDQTIIVGDKDWFYLPSDENNHFFFNELYQSNSFIRKKLDIERITHPVLGNVKGIVTIGLDYTIYLTDGTMLEVNAEENPGQIYNSSLAIDDWTFDALTAHYKTLVRYINFEDMGMILGYGCGSPSMTRSGKYPDQAYKLGLSL